MQRKEPLKEILAATRGVWDSDAFRPAVRANFAKVLLCRTEALGSEVYASDTEQKIVHHTCKSRACPSCGYRATRIWQRNLYASLPDVTFAGVVFTMPDVLWPIFQSNRHLLADLPALGAAVIQEWAKEAHGASLMVLAVPHTFGRHLNFNPHLHLLASAGGMRLSDDQWVSGIIFDPTALMRRWRYAVITYLRAALQRALFAHDATPRAVRAMLTAQYERWWSIDVQTTASKKHFIQYAGRYMCRPPLAQYRILDVPEEVVRFRTKDHRLRREVVTEYATNTLIQHLAEHVPDHYRHGIRYFGLLSPRSKNRALGALFAQLRQFRRPKPPRISWSFSIQKEFGVNPLRDAEGERMRLVSRRPPTKPLKQAL